MVNKQLPYVSVVMTSYNREKYIRQAIDSILAQECSFPFEIIIGDDCSTDNSRKLLQAYNEKYPDIIVLNLQEENVGFGPNWASTLKLARGKFVAFLDDDDYYCNVHRLQSMVDYMETHPEYGLTHTNYYNLYVETGELVPNNAKDTTGQNALKSLQSGTYSLCFGACMIRMDLIKQYIPLDDYIRIGFPIQDWPTCMLLAQHTEFMYLNQLSYVYRKHKGSMSSPMEYETIVRKYTKEKEMNRYIYEKVGLPFDEDDQDKYRNKVLLSLAYQKGDYCRAREYAKLTYSHNKQAIFARTWITFHLFRVVKRIKNSLIH